MDTKRPFRFGVVAESAPSRDQWISLVRKTENLDYATFLLADHCVNEFPPSTCSQADASNWALGLAGTGQNTSLRSIFW